MSAEKEDFDREAREWADALAALSLGDRRPLANALIWGGVFIPPEVRLVLAGAVREMKLPTRRGVNRELSLNDRALVAYRYLLWQRNASEWRREKSDAFNKFCAETARVVGKKTGTIKKLLLELGLRPARRFRRKRSGGATRYNSALNNASEF